MEVPLFTIWGALKTRSVLQKFKCRNILKISIRKNDVYLFVIKAININFLLLYATALPLNLEIDFENETENLNTKHSFELYLIVTLLSKIITKFYSFKLYLWH